MAIPKHNATTRGVRSGPKMSENAQFWGRMYVPNTYLRTYLQNHPETPFWGTFQCGTYYTEPSVSRTLMELRHCGHTVRCESSRVPAINLAPLKIQKWQVLI